jgi:site-specific recombinase XerD
MNLKPPGLTVAKAIPGFLQYKEAEALSPNTIQSYTENLALWQEYVGNRALAKVTTHSRVN